MSDICARCMDSVNKKLDLGDIDPAFRGFVLQNGQIITPNGYAYPPGFLYAIPIRIQQVEELKRELAQPRQLQF